MRRIALAPAVVLGLIATLLVAAPVSAAVTGVLCGEVTAFTAPDLVADADGSVEIDGTTEVIDAAADLDATVLAALAAAASADATVCLSITADTAGAIVDIELAGSAEICGDVALDTTTGVYTVDGVALAPAVVAADAELQAVLDAAVTAGASVCVDVAADATSGLIVGAAVTATINVCGEVTLDADGNATVDGALIAESLLSADLAALLQLAASADGTACVTVAAASSGTDTTVSVSVDIDVCAEVTAVTDDTITLNGITLSLAGAAAAGIEIGDVLCVEASTGPTGGTIVTNPDEVLGGGETVTPGGGAPTLPDTAVPAPAGAPLVLVGGLLVALAILGRGAVTRVEGEGR